MDTGGGGENHMEAEQSTTTSLRLQSFSGSGNNATYVSQDVATPAALSWGLHGGSVAPAFAVNGNKVAPQFSLGPFNGVSSSSSQNQYPHHHLPGRSGWPTLDAASDNRYAPLLPMVRPVLPTHVAAPLGFASSVKPGNFFGVGGTRHHHQHHQQVLVAPPPDYRVFAPPVATSPLYQFDHHHQQHHHSQLTRPPLQGGPAPWPSPAFGAHPYPFSLVHPVERVGAAASSWPAGFGVPYRPAFP